MILFEYGQQKYCNGIIKVLSAIAIKQAVRHCTVLVQFSWQSSKYTQINPIAFSPNYCNHSYSAL